MAVPEQIRKQSEAIAKLYADMNADATATAGDSPESAQPTEADRATSEAPTAAPIEQGRPAPKPEDTFEQRYRTLQGMYNADTGRLRSENQQLSARLSQLESLIASMPTAAPEPTVAEKLITDKDVEEYGDSIEVMRRVSREEAAAQQRKIAELENLVRQMQTNVLPRVEQVAQKQAYSAEQLFWTELSTLVPDWRDVNGNTEFHNWLLEVDPLSGTTRQSHLEAAQQAMDARRVANFFSTWKGSSGQAIAQSTRNAPASQLEKQVAPGRSRAGNAPTDQSNAKTYSPADITKFFDDVRKGVYRGKEAERDRIERDIFAAQRDGRIVTDG